MSESSVRVTWGDGKRSSGKARASHRYGGPGPFKLTIRAADAAGNKLTSTRSFRP